MVKKRTSLSVPDRLARALADITIYEAKQILENLAHEYMTEGITITDWTAICPVKQTTVAAEYHISWDCYSFAREVKFSFLGGPPTRRYKTYHGTLLMYVCDRILSHAAQFGPRSVLHVLKPYGFTMEVKNGKRCADGQIVEV